MLYVKVLEFTYDVHTFVHVHGEVVQGYITNVPPVSWLHTLVNYNGAHDQMLD